MDEASFGSGCQVQGAEICFRLLVSDEEKWHSIKAPKRLPCHRLHPGSERRSMGHVNPVTKIVLKRPQRDSDAFPSPKSPQCKQVKALKQVVSPSRTLASQNSEATRLRLSCNSMYQCPTPDQQLRMSSCQTLDTQLQKANTPEQKGHQI